jgi:hypothetical protein
MGTDIAHARESLAVAVALAVPDSANGTTAWKIERFDEDQTRWVKRRSGLSAPTGDDFRRLAVDPYDTSRFHGNLITTAGWTRLSNLLTAQGATQGLSATATRIGVGDGTTPAEAYADADLAAASGATHRYFQPVSGAGSLGTRTIAFAASFGTADGNFAWNEIGLDVGTPTVTGGTTVAALLFNHKVGISQGTKASGQTWVATATITWT